MEKLESLRPLVGKTIIDENKAEYEVIRTYYDWFENTVRIVCKEGRYYKEFYPEEVTIKEEL